MKRLASTGGKGGVGKSTIAVLLSFYFVKQGKSVVLCDADVECPNDHLLLGKKLKQSEPITQDFPTLEEEQCPKCGLCSETCRENAIFWVKENYPKFILDLCTGCGACWHVCPTGAIHTKEKIIGESFVNQINDRFWLVTGRSKTGIAETGIAETIVGEVKKRAIKLAKEKCADYFLIDTAPGTHCSVINALLGVDKAFAVTEPTPLGVHDLRLILQLLQKLDLPSDVVLNRADIGERKPIEEIAKEFETEITMEIPYSEELVRAYASQRLEEMVKLL